MVIQDKIFKFLFFLLLFSGKLLFSFSVEESMRKLSFREKRNMEAFFNKAIQFDQAGHVIFFETKPVTLIAIILQSRGKKIKEEIKALKGWKTFKKKHQELFPHPNFIFTENLFEPDDDLSVLHIYLINKSSLEKCLMRHQATFKEILGKDFSTEQLFYRLKQGEPLSEIIHHDEQLMGLLLGFGEESSKAFKRCSEDSSSLTQTITEAVCIKMPKSCPFMPIIFRGDSNSDEVKQLVSEYEFESAWIWDKYKSTKSVLGIALEGLCK